MKHTPQLRALFPAVYQSIWEIAIVFAPIAISANLLSSDRDIGFIGVTWAIFLAVAVCLSTVRRYRDPKILADKQRSQYVAIYSILTASLIAINMIIWIVAKQANTGYWLQLVVMWGVAIILLLLRPRRILA